MGDADAARGSVGDVRDGAQAVEVPLTERRTATYRRTFTTVDLARMTAPMREMRRDLEALASLDHAEVPHEYGDVRFLVHRATSTVFAELDVHVYEFPATENLEE